MLYQKILGGKFLNLAVVYMKTLATTIQRVSFLLWGIMLLGPLQFKERNPVALVRYMSQRNCYCACAGAWPVLVDEFVDNMYRYATSL